MSKYSIKHHQIIGSALSNFNADFFCEHNIVFGGGTRIALELGEFRESVDIDFLCPDKKSYRVVREQVTNISLGHLVKEEFKYLRDIRADRDAVRTVIAYQGINIKVEFISCDNYDLSAKIDTTLFPVPFLDHASCFYTKLLANADRKLIEPFKDIFDILAMFDAWGPIPELAIILAESHYGKKVIIPDLIKSLNHMIAKPDNYTRSAAVLKMRSDSIDNIVNRLPPLLLKSLEQNKIAVMMLGY
jgi:nucleotidyltransferase AbiEii toxin of type IV toxin-antitoxin system